MGNLTEIAQATKEQLEEMTVVQLRNLSKGVVKGYSQKRKVDLIKAVLDEGQKLRELAGSLDEGKAAQEISELSENLGDYSKGYFKQFKAIVEKNLDMTTGETNQLIFAEIAGLATKLVAYLDTIPGQQANGGIANSTKLRYRSEVISALKDSITAEKGSFLYPAMQSATKILDACLAQALQSLTKEKERLYGEALADRKEVMESDATHTINIAPLLSMSEWVLKNLDTLETKQWKLVSIALALTTGRRLAEIHGNDTVFEVEGDEIKFTGQLKAKQGAEIYYNENPSYNIPCLVAPELAVAGLEWLREQSKTCDTPKQVHNRFNRYISEAMKSVKSELGIQAEKFSYKSLRSVYADICFQKSGRVAKEKYLAEILGHGRGDLQAGSKKIRDFATPQSYMSDWVVKL